MNPALDANASARELRWRGQPSPWLHEEVGRRMESRLQWLRQAPQNWLHWMPARGGWDTHRLLEQRYAQARCYLVEPDPKAQQASQQALHQSLWRRWSGRAPQRRWVMPAPAGVDMVWANMVVHALADPAQLLLQWQEALAPGGFLMFSCLGPDSLQELRALYEQLGWPPCAHAFTDMHDWGDMLLRCGFAEPVMDMERITLTWPSAHALLAELRTLGRNLHPARSAGLRGRAWQQQLVQRLGQALAQPAQDGQGAGRLALSFEVIYGHAFKSTQARAQPDQPSVISLAQLRSGPMGRSPS